MLLNPGFRIDDHSDLQPDVSRRVHGIDHLLGPKNNLTIQTQVISGARAFIGNYGGLSYVPPFYGVRSLAFYSSPAHVAAPPSGPDVPCGGQTEARVVRRARRQFTRPAQHDHGGVIRELADTVVHAGWTGQPVARLGGVRAMKVLFVLQYPGYLRYFDSALEALSQRGHHVAVGFDQLHKQTEGLAALEAMDGMVEEIGQAPRRYDIWRPVALGVRGTIDYARYLHPRFKESSYLRDRMRLILPPLTRVLGRWTTTTAARTGRLVRALQSCERAVPSSAVIEAWLRGIDPDVLVISPLVTDQSTQVDVIKAARRVGVRSALCVASWDHLTTKGLMRIQPDLVALWNHDQRREAIEFHGVEAKRIVVTGAQCFDRWFDRTPRRTRNDFCARVGLRPDRPFVVFVGSTASISTPAAEVQFVTRWIAAVRNGPGSLADVRHPDPAAPLQLRALGFGRSVAVSGGRRVSPPRRQPGRQRRPGRLLRHPAPRRRDRRHQYLGPDRGRNPEPTGVHDRRRIVRRHANRHAAFPIPAARERRAPATRGQSRRAHAATLGDHRRWGRRHRRRRSSRRSCGRTGLDVPATPRLVQALEQLADRPARTPAPLPLHLWPLRAGLWTLAVWLRLIDFRYWGKRLRRLWMRLRNRLRLWRHYRTIRRFLREMVARRVRKRLSQRRYRYEMALWQYYKTRRKSFREWRARRSGAGGSTL